MCIQQVKPLIMHSIDQRVGGDLMQLQMETKGKEEWHLRSGLQGSQS